MVNGIGGAQGLIGTPDQYCKILECAETTSERVLRGEHKPFFGISLSNRFFRSSHNLRQYFSWAASVHRNGTLPVVIVDSPHTVNIEALGILWDGVATHTCDESAIREGDRMLRIVQDAIAASPDEVGRRVRVWRWDELAKASNGKYRHNLEVLTERYVVENGEFHRQVRAIVEGIMGHQVRQLGGDWHIHERRLCRLGEYVVREVAMIVGGLDVFEEGRLPAKFDLSPYPSRSEMQGLVSALETGSGRGDMSRLTGKLKLSGRLCSVALSVAAAGLMVFLFIKKQAVTDQPLARNA